MISHDSSAMYGPVIVLKALDLKITALVAQSWLLKHLRKWPAIGNYGLYVGHNIEQYKTVAMIKGNSNIILGFFFLYNLFI